MTPVPREVASMSSIVPDQLLPNRPPAPLMTVKPEIRLEILRHLLLMERKQVFKYNSAGLKTEDFRTMARDPYRSEVITSTSPQP
jgi:hypothetical protein